MPSVFASPSWLQVADRKQNAHPVVCSAPAWNVSCACLRSTQHSTRSISPRSARHTLPRSQGHGQRGQLDGGSEQRRKIAARVRMHLWSFPLQVGITLKRITKLTSDCPYYRLRNERTGRVTRLHRRARTLPLYPFTFALTQPTVQVHWVGSQSGTS
jgi:hypothetical protein